MKHLGLLNKFAYFTTIALSGIALWAVIPISYNTYKGVNPCPNVSIVPACHIVTVGYLLMALSCLLKKKTLFYIGWSPVFLLAAIGSISEVAGIDVCPKSASNTPMCYYSLGFSLVIAASFYAWTKTRRSNSDGVY